MIKRFVDVIFSAIALLLLSPLFIILFLWVKIDSEGGAFYKQKRVGRYGYEFTLWKFRSMKPNSDQKGLLSIGRKDQRVTKAGHLLRLVKLDELPQLWNVLIGDMSLVGPRPEVKKYTDQYTDLQKSVLSIRPGITDFASLHFYNESQLLEQASDPETYYINEIMPKKLEINLMYIQNQSLWMDIHILWLTMLKTLGFRPSIPDFRHRG